MSGVPYHLKMAEDAVTGQLLMTTRDYHLRLAVGRQNGPALENLFEGEWVVMTGKGWRRMSAAEADACAQFEARDQIEWNKVYVACLRKLGFMLVDNPNAGPQAPRSVPIDDGYRYVNPAFICPIYVRK